MSGSASESRDISFRVNRGVRSPEINNFGHSPSKTLLSFSPTAANSGTDEKCLLRKSRVTEKRISSGASLVGEKHRYIQRKDLKSTSSSSFFTDRCFTHWFGGGGGWGVGWGWAVQKEVKTGGTWTQQEGRMHINELELVALKLALETFFKAQEIESLHIQMDNKH